MLKRKLDSKHEPTAKRKQTGDTYIDPKPSKRKQSLGETTSTASLVPKNYSPNQTTPLKQSLPKIQTKYTKRERTVLYQYILQTTPCGMLTKSHQSNAKGTQTSSLTRKNELCLFNNKHTEYSFLSPTSNSTDSFVHVNDSDAWQRELDSTWESSLRDNLKA